MKDKFCFIFTNFWMFRKFWLCTKVKYCYFTAIKLKYRIFRGMLNLLLCLYFNQLKEQSVWKILPLFSIFSKCFFTGSNFSWHVPWTWICDEFCPMIFLFNLLLGVGRWKWLKIFLCVCLTLTQQRTVRKWFVMPYSNVVKVYIGFRQKFKIKVQHSNEICRSTAPLGWGGFKFENWWTWPNYIDLYTRIIAISL